MVAKKLQGAVDYRGASQALAPYELSPDRSPSACLQQVPVGPEFWKYLTACSALLGLNGLWVFLIVALALLLRALRVSVRPCQTQWLLSQGKVQGF